MSEAPISSGRPLRIGEPSGSRTPTTSRLPGARWTKIIGVIAVLLGLGLWSVLQHETSSEPRDAAPESGAVAVSEQGIRTLAKALGQPIYWSGPASGFTYELSRTANGRIYLRYLPSGVQVGSSARYLTIATYPLANAFAATSLAAKRKTSVKVPAESGAVAFYNASSPTNVYVAFPGSNFQIEVYAPSAQSARRSVASGKIRSIAGLNTSTTPIRPTAPKTSAVAVTPAGLKSAAARLGRSIFWAGTIGGQTYELTRTPDDRVYVRYLPAGVALGSRQPFLTVGTYPLRNAYATTASAAKQAGAVTIPVAAGVAFYSAARPTSVYLAFKGTDEQIEVFAPDAAAVHKLVAAGGVQRAT